MSAQTTLRAWLYSTTLPYLVSEAQRTFPFETGGCLMGYWWDKYNEVVITGIIGPGPKAIHQKHSFIADFEWQQERIHEIYQGSGRHITYLGDWHTHPGSNCPPSRKDLNALRKISECKQARAQFPLMGILYGPDEWSLGIWKYERVKKLKILPSERIYPMHIEVIEIGAAKEGI